jgi:hypothetical protein
MPKGAGSQKRKKRGSGDAGTSSGPSTHNLRPPRGQPPPPVYYGDDIEMSDRVESSDDDVEDPSLNFELSWLNRGVAGGGNDSDGDSVTVLRKRKREKNRGVVMSSLVGHTSGSLTILPTEGQLIIIRRRWQTR